MVKKESNYKDEVKTLITAYGAASLAKFLKVTERGMQYWIAEIDPKVPRGTVQRKIHELFINHKNGEDLSELLSNQQPDLRDEVNSLLRKENVRLQKDLDVNLKGIRRRLALTQAIAETNQDLLIDILAKQNKQTVGVVAARANKANDEKLKRILKEDNLSVEDI